LSISKFIYLADSTQIQMSSRRAARGEVGGAS